MGGGDHGRGAGGVTIMVWTRGGDGKGGGCPRHGGGQKGRGKDGVGGRSIGGPGASRACGGTGRVPVR